MKGEKVMKTRTVSFVVALALVAGLFTVGMAPAAAPPEKGGVFPGIRLPVPTDEAQKRYLGLEGDKAFGIPEIKAQMVIVEVFNTY
jgi:hypothetical protein